MKYDYTKGNLHKNIALLGLPMAMEMILLSTYNLVDIFFISSLGENAIAAVGLSGAVLLVPISISIGMCKSISILISRRIGEKNLKKASQILGHTFWIAILSGTILGLIGSLFSEYFLTLLGGTKHVIETGKIYLQQRLLWLFIGNLLFSLNTCLRSVGNAKIALLMLAITNIINIILDPILIFGFGSIPAYGVKGAAYATILGQSIGVIVQLFIFINGTDRLKLTLKSLKLKITIIWQIIRLTAFTVPHMLLTMGSTLFLNRLVSYYGTTAIASFTIVIRIHLFGCLPLIGISNAIEILVGQNLGAKEFKRVEDTVNLGIVYALFYMILVSIFYWINASYIISLLNSSMEILSEGTCCLKFFILTYPQIAINNIIVSTLNAAGYVKVNLCLAVLNRWLFRLFVGYLISVILGVGIVGIWFAINIAELIQTFLGYYFLRRGKWREIAV